MTTRIEFIIPTLVEGGAEKQLALLATHLPKDQFDVGVTTLTFDGPYRRWLDEAEIRVHGIQKRFKIDPFAKRRLDRHLASVRPDIVHTWIFAANAYGRASALRTGVPVIIGSERCVDPWKKQHELLIDRYLAKRTSAITTNSRGVVDFYAARGIPEARFHVIPNGIVLPNLPDDSRECSEARDAVFRKFDLPSDKRVVISIGRLWAQKDYRTLIWAAELLRVTREDIVFVIAGDGPERQRLEHYVDQIRAAASILFIGHRSDLSELLPHCDLLLNASLYEGQSNSIMEAMANRIPVIASDIPGNRDLVIDQKTGLLVPPKNPHALCQAAHALLSQPDQAAQLAKTAEQRLRDEFSLSRNVERHIELYHQLLEQKNRSASDSS